jgi:hypothetical protein
MVQTVWERLHFTLKIPSLCVILILRFISPFAKISLRMVPFTTGDRATFFWRNPGLQPPKNTTKTFYDKENNQKLVTLRLNPTNFLNGYFGAF